MFKQLIPLLVLVGCTTADRETAYIPVDPATVKVFHFMMAGFSGDAIDITFDNEHATFAGYRIESQAERDCRWLVAAPGPIDATALRELLAMSSTATLSAAACARSNTSDITIDGDFLGVSLDGAEYSGHPLACAQFVEPTGLRAALATTLDSLHPVVERVQFDGQGYTPVGACD